MMSEFAQRVMQLAIYLGPLEGATHYGESDPPGEGPYVQFWLTVQDGKVSQAAFRSPGCPSSRACGSVLCALVMGRELEKAAGMVASDLLAVVGELPEGKGHYADRAIRAMKLALSQPVVGQVEARVQ